MLINVTLFLYTRVICAVFYTDVKWTATGAIIGDGDRKRAPFLVLGLSP